MAVDESFDEYVATRALGLTRFAYVLTNDVHAAEDVVQGALLKVFRHWSRISRADHPDAYIRRVIVTTHLSSVRGRRPVEVLRSVLPERAAVGAAGDPAEQVSQRDTLRLALATLPARQRAVLVMRHYAGMDDSAIADVLRCGVGTVRAHASKGATALRLVLSDDQLLAPSKGDAR